MEKVVTEEKPVTLAEQIAGMSFEERVAGFDAQLQSLQQLWGIKIEAHLLHGGVLNAKTGKPLYALEIVPLDVQSK